MTITRTIEEHPVYEVRSYNEAGAWEWARLILESCEPGASRHCLRQERYADRTVWTHVRLGVSIVGYF